MLGVSSGWGETLPCSAAALVEPVPSTWTLQQRCFLWLLGLGLELDRARQRSRVPGAAGQRCSLRLTACVLSVWGCSLDPERVLLSPGSLAVVLCPGCPFLCGAWTATATLPSSRTSSRQGFPFLSGYLQRALGAGKE